MVAGFDWLAGLEATRTAYLAGVAPERPDRYFIVANLVVFAVAVGPAAVAGVVWLRDRAAWWLVGGALAGVLAADLSTMSKGEVERIWLPAVPFVVLATSAIRGRTARTRLAGCAARSRPVADRGARLALVSGRHDQAATSRPVNASSRVVSSASSGASTLGP